MSRQERGEWSRCTGAIRKIGKLRVQNDRRRAKTSELYIKLPESLWESVSGGRSSSPGPSLGVKAVDTPSLEGKTRSVSPAGSSAVEDAMAERSNKPCSHIPLKCEMRVIAAVHCVAAIVVAVLFVTQHLMRYWNKMHLLSLQLENLCWIAPICLLLAVSCGLWNQLTWARSLALVLDWSIFVGALGITALFAGSIVVWVPKNGFDLSTAIMATSMLVLLPIVLVSASTLWGLHRGFGAISAGTAILIILFVVFAEAAATWAVCTWLWG